MPGDPLGGVVQLTVRTSIIIVDSITDLSPRFYGSRMLSCRPRASGYRK